MIYGKVRGFESGVFKEKGDAQRDKYMKQGFRWALGMTQEVDSKFTDCCMPHIERIG